jgi:hypothetical protein
LSSLRLLHGLGLSLSLSLSLIRGWGWVRFSRGEIKDHRANDDQRRHGYADHLPA